MMYTRAYYQDTLTSPPENYDGNAFRGASDDTPPTYVTPTVTEPKISPGFSHDESRESDSEPTGVRAETGKKDSWWSSLFSRLPIKSLLGGTDIFDRIRRSIDIEDIMLLAIAALLLFSPDGDRLLGIALIALLFVKE